ncbi:N-acetyltransferase [Sphingomonas sp. S1-29]|uniref:N-acetyltransferase n=1 Tax=Sphingomonas sp. S1-29 TaxID=2991074 RepID=UPI002240A997|nr:N-acetyltransferase [Sphingomonas sp. S1-29]UZK70618.1 N-acetyltransferase [Sphingomonas sp. S1-29]
MIAIRPVATRADRSKFIDLAYRLNARDPNWIAPLRSEVAETIDPAKNGWFSHAEGQLFLAERDGQVVGRISAHVDTLALTMPADRGFGPGAGQWGLFEAEDEEVAHALIATAETWLRNRGLTRALGPISLSIWEQPGLLVEGFDHPPTVMMGHNLPEQRGWIERAGYTPAKELVTYDLDITPDFPPIVGRIIAAGEKNPRIVIRRVDKSRFDEEAGIILAILNDAWRDNWGFVPLTPPEIADVGRKLKPIVFEDLIRIAEVDGEPVAFLITLPDLNEAIAPLNGNLFPFGWAKLLWWLRTPPQCRTVRVPLMGVVKRLQASRMASQLAFMMIEYVRRDTLAKFGATRGEIGWILDDNQGMIAIADAIKAKINKRYTIYERTL